MMVSVKLSEATTVVPAIPSMKRRLFLSNLDLLWMHVSQEQRVIFYKTNPEDQFSKLVENLKSSLSSVLVPFYPLAGRLVEDESGRPEVECNDAGVEFIEASIGMEFLELEKDDFQYKSFFKKLVVTRTDDSQHQSFDWRWPLLTIQVTDFLGGGVCIGTTLHHVIADGNSFWHFMRCWAERSRGVPISEKPEHFRAIFKRHEKNYKIPKMSFRTEELISEKAQILKFLPDDSQPTNYEPKIADDKELKNTSTDHNKIPILFSVKDKTDLETSTFNFSEDFIRKLKNQTEARTSFVAVAAHFWRCIVKAREISENEPVVFLLLADCRSRVNPPLSSSYFGNCLCTGGARTTAKELLEQDVRFAANLIQEVISSCTKTEVQLHNMIDFLNESLANEIESFPAQLLKVTRHIVNVVSSPRFPVHEIDFGWGKPVRVHSASINQLGSMVLFPGRDTEGKSIDLTTCLPRRQMKILKQILMTIHG